MYIIGLIILSFFALVGAVGFITALFGRSFDDSNPSELVLKALTAETAEVRVRRAAERCAQLRCEHLRCECLDDEALLICEKLRREYPVIEAVDKAEATEKRL